MKTFSTKITAPMVLNGVGRSAWLALLLDFEKGNEQIGNHLNGNPDKYPGMWIKPNATVTY